MDESGADQVGSVVAQWPILAIFLAGILVAVGAWKLWGNGRKGDDTPPIASDAGAIMHALTAISAEVAGQGRAMVTHIDHVAAGLSTQITDVSAQLQTHMQRDDQRFDVVHRRIDEALAGKSWDATKTDRRART